MARITTQPNWRIALLILRVDMGAPIQHQLDKELMSLVTGNRQRRIA